MHNLGMLYRYELKKIAKRKVLWITSALILLAIVFTATAGLLGTYYIDGEPAESHYQMYKTDQAYRKALSGRVIDQELLQETVDGYRKIPDSEEHYTFTEEYQTYARPYSDIYHLIRSWTKNDVSSFQNLVVDEDTFYASRLERLEEQWKSIPLTDTEKEFWRSQEAKLTIPFTYRYHEGYEEALDSCMTIGVLMWFFAAICLSNSFSDEHVRRTDQLVLSSAKGKTKAYWAKLLAGITVSVIAATLMSLVLIGTCLAVFGAEGFTAPLQISYTFSYPLTIGQACLIAYGILILTSVLVAAFVMTLSEILRNGIATFGISSALIILGGMITIPSHYRVLAQIWDWSPMAYLSPWNIFDERTVTLFGHCFVSWQIVPVVYILCSIALVFAGKYFYQRYQVSGR